MRIVLTKSILTAAAVFVWSLAANAAELEMKVPRVAEPFSLTDVKLLDGPFRDAMVRDQKYLLSLDPDRLLHTFRLNVRLPSSAQPLGGWEAPDCQLRGHSMGHYPTSNRSGDGDRNQFSKAESANRRSESARFPAVAPQICLILLAIQV